VLVTSSVIQGNSQRTFQVVPLTTNVGCDLLHELLLETWRPPSAAQCHLLAIVDHAARAGVVLGQVSPVDLHRIRELLRDVLDIDE
jgi:hypothetical protein